MTAKAIRTVLTRMAAQSADFKLLKAGYDALGRHGQREYLMRFATCKDVKEVERRMNKDLYPTRAGQP